MTLMSFQLSWYNMYNDAVAPYLPSHGVELYKAMIVYQQAMCERVKKSLYSLLVMYNQLMLGITFVMHPMEWASL